MGGRGGGGAEERNRERDVLCGEYIYIEREREAYLRAGEEDMNKGGGGWERQKRAAVVGLVGGVGGGGR